MRRKNVPGLGLVVLGIASATIAYLALKRPVLEQSYLWELESEYEPNRIAAATRLGNMQSTKAISPLIELLQQDHANGGDRIRKPVKLHYSAAALVDIGLPAVAGLIGVSKSEDPRVRWNAAEALGQIGRREHAAVPPLTLGLQHANAHVRAIAVSALGKVGPQARNAVPTLIELLQDEDAYVRVCSVNALGRIGPAAKAGVAGLIESLKDESSPVLRAGAAWSLGRIGPEARDAIPVLVETLNDEEQELRLLAAEALRSIDGKSGSRNVLPRQPRPAAAGRRQ